MKYALMINLGSDEEDWIYVTEGTSENCWDLRPVVYEDFQRAEQAASIWRNQGTGKVKVVELLQEV